MPLVHLLTRVCSRAAGADAASRYHGEMPRLRLALTLAFLAVGTAHAAPPADADPALAPWFNSLRQPWTNALCCSIADCRPVESRLNDGHYEALIEGEWRRIPDQLILSRSDNPTGRAIACWTRQVGILCFVRAPES